MSLNGSVDGGVAVFVMPVFLDGGTEALGWLSQAVDSVLNQTDSHWRLVMINDVSPLPETADELTRLQAKDERIHVITLPTNSGPGIARNVGVQWAHDHGFPYILFLDSDDISHPDRVRTVRGIMSKNPDIGVVYSTFTVIDEMSNKVAETSLSESIRGVIECNRKNPPQGETAWIDIGTVTGYANLTSSTAVTTDLAMKQPFPNERAVEDLHAWFRYAAEGKKFVYTPDIPALYRIPQSAAHSAMRDRMGGIKAYYAKQCAVARDGFERAIDIATARGRIKPSERERLLAGYHVRMAESMRRANQSDLIQNELERAMAISSNHTREWIEFHGYEWAKRRSLAL